MIDEVQTGGGPTGKMWAFEHFNLPEAPDIVSFRYTVGLPKYFLVKRLKLRRELWAKR